MLVIIFIITVISGIIFWHNLKNFNMSNRALVVVTLFWPFMLLEGILTLFYENYTKYLEKVINSVKLPVKVNEFLIKLREDK